MKLRAIDPDRSCVFARACLEASKEEADAALEVVPVPLDWISSAYVSPRDFSLLLAGRDMSDKRAGDSQEGEITQIDEWVHGFLVQISKGGELDLVGSYLTLRPSSLLVNESNAILLPPHALHKLSIFRHRFSDAGFDDRLSVEVIEATSITPKIIGSLYLSSLSRAGQDEELEKAAMELYFSVPRYLVDRDIICVPIASARMKHTNNDAGLEEIVYRWYLVESKGGMDVDITSPVHTKITLSESPSRPCSLPDIDSTSKLVCSELAFRRSQSPNDYSKMLSGAYLWSQFVSGRSYTLRFLDMDSFRDGTEIPPDCPLPTSSKRILNHLSPALELTLVTYSNGNSNSDRNGASTEELREALSSSPLLVESQPGQARRQRILLGCAGVLGMHLYTLDARFLWEYNSDGGKFDNIGAAGLFTPDWEQEDSLRNTTSTQACTSHALEVVKRAPCLLYIEGIDDVLADIRGLRLDANANASSPEALLAQSIENFLSQIELLRGRGQGVCVNEKETRADRLLVPIAIVESRESLSPEFQALFQREVDLSCTASMGTIGKRTGRRDANNSNYNDSNSYKGSGDVELAVKREVAGFLGVRESVVAPPCTSRPSLSSDRITDDDSDGGGDGVSSNLLDSNISPVYWADIGGLDEVRKEILDIIQLPSLRPDLFPSGCPRRRAALLYGAPGTGKTLVAKAVATECGMNFLSIKGPELLDMYVGESERNVRRVFENARKHVPCVVFFDELDSLAPARGRGGDGGGVMDRVVAQLLTEMDSLSSSSSLSGPVNGGSGDGGGGPHRGDVFVLGATNRPDLLDPALLRPGRFDRKIYLSVCRDANTRENILAAQTRRVQLGSDFTLREVSALLPDTLTGADIGGLVSRAFTSAQQRTLNILRGEIELQVRQERAVTDHREASDKEEGMVREVAARLNRLPGYRLRVIVERGDLLEAADKLVPSVSLSELQHYERLAQEYSDLASS